MTEPVDKPNPELPADGNAQGSPAHTGAGKADASGGAPPGGAPPGSPAPADANKGNTPSATPPPSDRTRDRTPEPPAALPPSLPAAVLAKRWQWSSWAIWLVPILAAVVAAGIIAQTLMERGGMISIQFKSAEGLEAGKTKIKYKDVDIGDVKTITLSPDRQKVIITAQLTKGNNNLMREDTVFWVVRPRIGAGGISGLSTLLSGPYIEVDVGKSAETREEFIGLDAPPPILNGLAGRVYSLQAEQMGSLDIGAPVYFRHIQVGQVVSYELDKAGRGVNLKVFINAPYDQYVQTNSLFWHASGVEISVDANGFKVQTESVATVVAGGVSFDTPNSSQAKTRAPANAEFHLFSNRQKALQHPDVEIRRMRMYFKESVRGLAAGAPVDFRGIVIGEVQNVSLEYDSASKRYRFPVDVNLYPQRLQGIGGDTQNGASGNLDSEQLMHRLLDQGLRAQLKTGNLLTGMLYVGLDFFPEAPKSKINWKQQPLVLDTMPGALDELQGSLVSIAKKLDQLPLADISNDLRQALAGLKTTLATTEKMVAHVDADVAPEVKKTLEQAHKTMAEMERTLSEDSPLQIEARGSLKEVQRAAEAVRHLADTLERHPESLIRGKQEDAK